MNWYSWGIIRTSLRIRTHSLMVLICSESCLFIFIFMYLYSYSCIYIHLCILYIYIHVFIFIFIFFIFMYLLSHSCYIFHIQVFIFTFILLFHIHGYVWFYSFICMVYFHDKRESEWMISHSYSAHQKPFYVLTIPDNAFWSRGPVWTSNAFISNFQMTSYPRSRAH